MTAPASLSWVFVALMLAVAGFCAGRMVLARRTGRPSELDSDIAHVLMGVAMAGMLASAVRIGTTPMWTVLFGGGAAWFAWQTLRVRIRGPQRSAWRCSQPVPHLVKCGAMLYMLLAVHATRPSGGTSSGMVMGTAGSRMSIVPLLLAGFMIGYVVLLADRFTSVATNTLARNTVAANTLAANTVAANTGGSIACAGILAPRCATMCKMAMGITMAYLLILML
jgi:Domain of unknown function (DUF5134)